MPKTLLIACLTLLVHLSVAQAPYFPDADWQTRRPEEVGMNKTRLDSAVAFALAHENAVDRDLRLATLKAYAREPNYKLLGPTRQRGGPAGLIVRRGYVVAQWGDVERVDMAFSVTKSFLSTVAGLAVDAGLIRRVTDPVSRYVWDETFEGPHNARITWEHLLNQSSDWSGTLFGLHDWADRPPREGTVDDWKNRTLHEPGTVYEYNDVRVNLLAYALLNVWRRPLPVVLKERLLDPIGASTTWRWLGYDHAYVNLDGQMLQSVSGGGHHGGGLFISTRDLARFGLLCLRRGQWKGQRLFSESWLRQARQPSAPNPQYGFLWWLNTDRRWPAVAPTVYSAQGFGGNYVIVDEEHELVVVTRWMDDAHVGEFLQRVVGAVEK